MTADLDAELEQAARQAFARMFGAISVALPEERPEMATTTLVPLDQQAGGASEQQRDRPSRRRRRNRAVVVAAAIVAAAAAVAALVMVPDRSTPGRVSTTNPSTTAPSTTDSTDSTDSTGPTTSSTASTSLPASTAPASDETGAPGEGGTGSSEIRPAERRGLLDPATSDIPLDRLADMVELQSANWPIVLQAAVDGERIALQLTVPGEPSYGAGIEGAVRPFYTHWMVDAIDNQFVVWGLVPSDIASVTIYTRDGQPVSGETVPVGPPALQSRVFAVILPELAYIDGAAGELADGTVVLAGVQLEAALAQFQQHSPSLREWTGFLPVVRH